MSIILPGVVASSRGGGTPAPTGLSKSYTLAYTGNSTQNGSNAGSGGTANYLGSRPHAPAIRVANLFNAAGIPACSEGTFGTGGNNTISVWSQADGTRYAQGGSWSSLANLSIFGGNCFQATTATGGVLRVVLFDVSRINIGWLVGSLAGTCTYTIDGGAPVTLDGSGTKALAVQRTAVTRGDHTVEVTWASGTPLIHSIWGDRPELNELRFLHAGARGALSSNFSSNTSSNPWLFRNAHAVFTPDILNVDILINDINQNVAAATAEANYRAYLDACRAINPNLALILNKPNPISIDGTGITQMQARTLIDTLASDYSAGGKIAVVHDRWASMGVSGVDGPAAYNDAVSKGKMSDTLHPNTTGYDDVGTGDYAVVRNVLTLLGETLP